MLYGCMLCLAWYSVDTLLLCRVMVSGGGEIHQQPAAGGCACSARSSQGSNTLGHVSHHPVPHASTRPRPDAHPPPPPCLPAGADRLKEALQQLGLKCGGTPRQRAERLFLLRSQPLEQLERKHFAAGVTVAMSEQELQRQEQVGWLSSWE